MSLKLVNLGRLSWFACLLLLPFSAKAQSESILDYHSDVQVHDDGRMEVRETIRVRSAGDRIRHGIYRDFLTRYTDRLGNRYVVGFLIGRDPAPGTIVALYEPPPGISPAAMRYLVRMGYDDKTFASAVLDMAVKGYVQIREQAGSYALNRTKLSPQALSPEETAAADTLFNGCASIWLHDENHTQISAAIRAMKAWLKNAEYKIYFLTNGRYMLPAILVSIAMQTGIVLLQAPQKMILAAVLTVWLTAWSFGVAAMLLVAIRLWKSAFEGGALKTQAIAITAISIPVFGFEALGLYILVTSTSVVVVVTLLLSVLIHGLFHQLLKAPTKAGRNVLDKIEGFKRFLSAVDGDRMNRLGLPANTPEVFEKYLPYALALDVEHAWAERFSGVLNGAAQAPGQNSAGYSPSWYSGSAWSSLGAAGFANSLGSSFSQAIASSSSAPGSTSGGSGNGGGSGGGGGGGGGGGW